MTGEPPWCSGDLLDNHLGIAIKLGDTVVVGSVGQWGDHTITYDITYDSCITIKSSGIITAEYYRHKDASRARGTFSFDAIDGKDTLHFSGGKFDVYLRGID